MPITSKQRAQLRGLAMHEDTIIQIGKGGITEAVIDSVNAALCARELVKGRVLENSMLTAREACDALSEACRAEQVQVIGTKFVLYKRNAKEPKIELVKDKKEMRIAIYGGSFNPPHLGHMEAARTVAAELAPDKLLVIPDNIPPHKAVEPGCPTAEERLELCRLAFRDIPGAEVSDMEIRRQGKSYTAHTVQALREKYPEDELCLVVGSDMFLCFEEWYEFRYLLGECTLAVISREEDDLDALRAHRERLVSEYSANVRLLSHAPLPMCSGEIRVWLRLRLGSDLLDGAVYADIIKHRWYDAMPELCWLREAVKPYLKPKRVAHVAGCESEAVKLAMRYGEDAESAAEAGILHDITKKLTREEQLILCDKYGIICDKDQLANEKLLHAITGAALARAEFGVSDAVYSAIRWHTTGKPDMTLLEKIIYMADYIEPTRDFAGVERLRTLAYKDIDAAMALGLEMSLEDIRAQGVQPHRDTVDAWQWYTAGHR